MLRFLALGALLLSATCGVQAQSQPSAKGATAAPVSSAPSPATAAPSVPTASLAVVQQALAKPGVILLDVRTPEEFAAGHLSNAQNLNFRAPEFATLVGQLDPTKTYVLYCASGNRSGKAAVLFQEKGFQKVLNAGAFKTLQESGVK